MSIVGGGYDDGYRACPCFWGRNPGSLVQRFVEARVALNDWRVLDLGCGEGKNAAYLAARGATVVALDLSPHALANGRRAWPEVERIQWVQGDAGDPAAIGEHYDLVIAYGLLHCLRNRNAIERTVAALQAATRPGGWNIVCTFNSRRQELAEAHPGFEPCLLAHDDYLRSYAGWRLSDASDTDLRETHPHNGVPHVHSMTRFIAEKPREAE